MVINLTAVTNSKDFNEGIYLMLDQFWCFNDLWTSIGYDTSVMIKLLTC